MENRALKESNEVTCRLCLQSAELRQSHILPKTAYKGLINKTSHPRMVVVRDVDEGQISDKNQQTGPWEYLLCQQCETRLSGYETYASKHLLERVFPNPRNISDLVITLNDFQYRPLKLFLLSILWRASVSKHDFFRCINLGSKHEEKLRVMLDSANPGAPDEYGCMITPLLPEENIHVEQLMAMPGSIRSDGHNGCLFQFRGFVFQFYVSRHRIPDAVQKTFLSEAGQLVLVRARIGDFQPLRELWNGTVDAIHREKRAEERSRSPV